MRTPSEVVRHAGVPAALVALVLTQDLNECGASLAAGARFAHETTPRLIPLESDQNYRQAITRIVARLPGKDTDDAYHRGAAGALCPQPGEDTDRTISAKGARYDDD